MRTRSNTNGAELLVAIARAARADRLMVEPARRPRAATLLCCLLAACLATPLPAQQPPKVGFIRVIHALAWGEGKMSLLIDGEDMFPKGYKLGQRTGGIGLQAGTHTIEVRQQGIVPGTTRLPLEAGETITLVAFAERLPTEDDEPPKWAAKLLRLRQREVERGYLLTAVSVSQRPEVTVRVAIEARGKVETGIVKRLATTTIDLGRARGEVDLRLGEEPLVSVSLDDPGNYVVVIYDDPSGKVKAISFYDPKFVIAG
jgi:hypothetical protein